MEMLLRYCSIRISGSLITVAGNECSRVLVIDFDLGISEKQNVARADRREDSLSSQIIENVGLRLCSFRMIR